jgi:hypothetical protein
MLYRGHLLGKIEKNVRSSGAARVKNLLLEEI